MKLLDWIRNKLSHESPPAPVTNKLGQSPFLDLPGEIRNQIYSYLIHPFNEVPIIVNCHKPKHLGNSTLKPGIFRVSRQVRGEALSYLCATKTIEIIGISSAIVFFKAVGEASKEVQDLVVWFLDPIQKKKGWASMLELFDWLDKMEGLKKLFMGRLELENRRQEAYVVIPPRFGGRITMLQERGVVVTVNVDLREEWVERQ